MTSYRPSTADGHGHGRWRRCALVAGAALLVLSSTALAAGTSAASPALPYCKAPTLYGVGAVAPDDVWTVGDCVDPDSGTYAGLTQHWDGTSWKTHQFILEGGMGNNSVDAVSALSADDVWIAGGYGDPAGEHGAFVEHWDGSTWTVVYNSQRLYGFLGLSALPDGDVFGVARIQHASQLRPVIWQLVDGHQSLSVQHIGPSDASLDSISMSSSTEGWAVGSRDSGPAPAVAEHWNGTSWTTVHIPGNQRRDLQLTGVSDLDPSDVWAAGTATVGQVSRKVVERLVDGQWTNVPTPPLGASESTMQAVSANAPDDVWAVGTALVAGSHQLLGYHWDGTAWTSSLVRSSTTEQDVWAVSSTPQAVWAVGDKGPGDGQVREFWDGTGWMAH